MNKHGLEEELTTLLRIRAKVQRAIITHTQELKDINQQILETMARMNETRKEIKHRRITLITPTSYRWFEKKVVKWYKNRGLKPPYQKVFDPALVEKDILEKRVPRKMLKSWVEEKEGTTYVRVDKI